MGRHCSCSCSCNLSQQCIGDGDNCCSWHRGGEAQASTRAHPLLWAGLVDSSDAGVVRYHLPSRANDSMASKEALGEKWLNLEFIQRRRQ